MKTLTLTAALIALALPAAAETTWTGTGPRGGTYAGSGSCAAGSGSITCNSSTTATNPWGQSATRSGTRVYTGEGVRKSFTTIGPAGRTTTATRERKR